MSDTPPDERPDDAEHDMKPGTEPQDADPAPDPTPDAEPPPETEPEPAFFAPADSTAPSVAPWRLLRLREGKVLGGVAGGIGRAAGVDLTLARMAVFAACLTGIGLVAYVVLWLVVPQEARWRGEVARRAPEPTRNYLSIGLVIAAVLGLLDILGSIGGALAWTRGNWSYGPGHRHGDFGVDFGGALGLLLIGFGAAILITRRRGPGPVDSDPAEPYATAMDDESLASDEGGSAWTLIVARIVGWLAVVWALIATGFGLLLWWAGAIRPGAPEVAVPLVAVALSIVVGTLIRSRRPGVIVASLLLLVVPFAVAGQADVDGDFGVRDLRVNDNNFQGAYRVAAGQLVLDLRDMEVLEGTRRLRVDMGAGQITVKLPASVTSVVTARAGLGDVAVLGQVRGGTDSVVHARTTGCPERGQLIIDLRTRVGRIEVEGAGVGVIPSCARPTDT